MSDSQPLEGRRIVVTRNLETAGRLSSRLTALGAEVLELPLIHIEYGADKQTTADIFEEIGQYEWLVFTSAHGVRGFFQVFLQAFEDIRALGLMRIAVVGEGTAAAVREWFLKVDLQPAEATADALGAALAEERSLDNVRMLVVTGNRNREDLVNLLNQAQAIVDTFPVYRTELTDLQSDAAAAEFREKGADVLIFSSSSAVESFGRQASHLKLVSGATVPALASFGPQTSKTMQAANIPIAIEARTPSLDAIVDALIEHFADK